MRIFTLLIALIFVCLTQASKSKPVVTFVTALYDVKRGGLQSHYKRSYQYYLKYYSELLQTDNNLIAFGDTQLKQFTAKNRPHPNTIFIQKQLTQIQKYWYTPKIWSVIDYYHQHPQQYGWDDMTKMAQFALKMYNPVVMSKLYLMRQAFQKDTFGTDYFIWTDGGLTHALDTEFLGRHTFDKIVNNYQIDWFFLANNYFNWDTMQVKFYHDALKYRTQDPIEKIQTNCWANWFGGKVEAMSTVLSIYQNLLRITLDSNQMNTDESIFTLMMQRYPYMLTKLNIKDPEEFSILEADRPSYNDEIAMERNYSLSSIVRESVRFSSIPLKPMIILSSSSYDTSVYPSLSRVYQTTLIFRLLTIVVTLVAYYMVKSRYLSHKSSLYENISSTQEQ